MPASFLQLFDQPSATQREMAGKIGACAWAALRHGAAHATPVRPFYRTVKEAIRRDHVRWYFGESGAVTGYVIWAWLDAVGRRQLCQGPNVVLHPSQYNDGDLPWILDLAAAPGSLRAIVCDLRGVLGVSPREVGYRRRVRLAVLAAPDVAGGDHA